MALGSTQFLAKMSTRNRRTVRKADNLTTFMCRVSWKSGSLNLLEPSGPRRACYGTPLPFTFTYVASQKIFSTSVTHFCVKTEHEEVGRLDTIINMECRNKNTPEPLFGHRCARRHLLTFVIGQGGHRSAKKLEHVVFLKPQWSIGRSCA